MRETMQRTPLSTYRLQLHAGFTFAQASAIADYVRDLGVSHVYSSPYLQAGKGSMHGYDVVDHHRVNTELGGEAGHAAFSKRLGELHMGQVLDIVPNHMSVDRQNRMWWDVLENGPSSRFATFFDIDWNSAEEKLRDKVLMPVLGDQYGRILSNGEIKIVREGTDFLVQYGEQAFPVAPRSLSTLLSRAAEMAPSDTLNFLAVSFARLPAPDSTERSVQLARHRDKQVLLGLLTRLCSEQEAVCRSIDAALEELNGNIDALDEFLNAQNFRLAFWRTSDQELGYRRFFDVNSLIGLRMEREYVFEETHELILYWLDKGVLDGVRIDHPDGLRDPKQYLERLRARAPHAWIVAEKILEPGEWLRADWPVQGTSGYDYMNQCNALLVHPDGMRKLTAIYSEFARDSESFHDIAFEKKTKISKETLASDVNRLASLFVAICESNRNSRDYTRAQIRRAIRNVAACFGIYRTYVVPAMAVNDEDLTHIHEAIEEAKRRKPDIDGGLFDFMRDVLTLKVTGDKESEFVARFQQFTSPVMAKGVEDTAFYCYNRLTSLNEVGGDPGLNGITIADFHSYNAHMQTTFPTTMLTLSTHDTKRGDDVRARLAVLSEVPARWAAVLKRWSRMNAKYRTGKYPDANTEYFLYQTLIGAWPIDIERLKAYMQKAMREAKRITSWLDNDKDYEDALNAFMERILEDGAFVGELQGFVERIKRDGRINSLSQTLLKCTSPGVPDLYQGGELWDHSLVDPDNRRPVDYDLRRAMLAELTSRNWSDAAQYAVEHFEEGSPKLWLITQALKLRLERPTSFDASGSYSPMEVHGPKADHVIAYRRSGDVIAIAPRFPHLLTDNWSGTSLQLPVGRWTDRLSGQVHEGGSMIRISTLLDGFPVALLVHDSDRTAGEDVRRAEAPQAAA
ncbi:malto-oligosyltrehalose synthase [Terriglobus roseus]|uniref:Maltooligosyl trehalose synthase n=1 Tax=Terriglobus roseus TaxID=392734 RepID=A0A1H4KRV7_9BACT|nr:maltooligosyl trehalose synthase [Terriglobus roseus]